MDERNDALVATTDSPSPDGSTRASDLSLGEQISLLSGKSAWETRDLPARGVKSVFVSDGPHGLRARPGVSDVGLGGAIPATCFPTAVTLGSTWDPELVRQVGRALGREATDIGVDVILGPGMNIKRHPLGGRNFEYFSEDPLLSGKLAGALSSGIQDEGVGACLKHYAVNNQESNRFVVDAIVDERTLRELYLRGFEIAIREAQPWTVMSSYNLVNGKHVGESPELLGILRDELGFDGLVMSDWGAVSDRPAAIAAGLDLEMPGSAGMWDSEVAAAVASGRLAADDVAKDAQRVLDLAAKARCKGADPNATVDPATLAANDALARRVAAAGSVLLANDGLLPLTGNPKIAVIGAFADKPRYQGSGSSLVNSARVTTLLDALRERGVEVSYAPGYEPLESADDARLLAEAVEVAHDADVAVVIAGLPPLIESEGFDRDDLEMPAQQNALISAVAAANPRTVVVLQNGAPVTMPWRNRVNAILEAYLGGQAGGAAIADLLFGEAEPGGRLAETFPASLSDVPSDANFPGEPHQVVYAERLNVGYRRTGDDAPKALFPFGYGLSYTTFDWSDIRLNLDAVTAADPDSGLALLITVTNTGNRAGTDVVQVYCHDATGLVERPRRELIAFEKIALAAGESRTIAIPIAPDSFAFWDANAHTWRTPSGQYEIEVGHNAEDIVAVLPLQVTGDLTEPYVDPGMAEFKPQRPVRPYTREATLGELADTWVGRRVGSLIRKNSFPTEEDPASQKMVDRMLEELPLRAGAAFSGGRLTLPMVDMILAAANGKPVGITKAMAGLAKNFRNN